MRAEEDISCPRCGKPLKTGETCPICGPLSDEWTLRGAPYILVILIAILLAGFSVTRFAVSAYQSKQRSLAAMWYQRGMKQMQDKQSAAKAVDDFENALALQLENNEYRLHLSEALIQAGRLTEARAHLLSLWDQRPGDSLVNLELARLSVQRGEIDVAVRYYEGAIYGVWPSGEVPSKARLSTRIEVATLLLENHRNQQAQSQLIAAVAEAPQEFDIWQQLGQMFLEAGDPQRSYTTLLHARRLNPRDRHVDIALGEAAFQMNKFELASRWLYDGVYAVPEDKQAAQLLKQVNDVEAIDPFRAGLNTRDRALRVINLYKTAFARLDQCFASFNPPATAPNQPQAPPSIANPFVLQAVSGMRDWSNQLKPKMTERRLRGQTDAQENAMRFVFQAEQTAQQYCALPSRPIDQTIQLLARERWSNE